MSLDAVGNDREDPMKGTRMPVFYARPKGICLCGFLDCVCVILPKVVVAFRIWAEYLSTWQLMMG